MAIHIWSFILFRTVLFASFSINFARGALDLTNQPPVIYVDALFQPIPQSRVAVQLQITNSNTQTIKILKWNSILEDFPVADLPFFITSEPENDAYAVSVSARAHANYHRVLNSHFISIQPGATYTKDIDLRQWVILKRATNYKISMTDQLRGFLHDGDLDLEPLPRSRVYTLPRIPMEAAEVTVSLAQSTEPPGIGQTIECQGEHKIVVGLAKEGANELANFVDQYRDQSDREWKDLFNGDSRIRDRVAITFSNIYNYGRPLRAAPILSGVREGCAANNVLPCGPGVATYHQLQRAEDLRIVFCDDFFNLLDAKKTCKIPGPANPDMNDQTGFYLRGLVWSKVGREFIIRDGFLNTCYGYFCAQAAATTRAVSRYQNSRQPRPGAEPPFEEGLPENIATNYVTYAYAMRAKSCAANKPKLCSRETCIKVKDYSWTAIRDNMKTIIIGALTSAVGTCVSIGVGKAG
ncbi:MAG: hypothetical protein M1812_005748 [Candelaria pacifica]|nr:MAG: hypothetical protein M1812_005748 [Candelaria pacifica]